MATLDEFLAHHGVKGMKWGVSRRKALSAPSSEDHARAAAAKTKAKKSGTHTLSNKELQDLVTRINLEQQYGRLNPSKKKVAAKFAGDILLQVGKQQATKLATDLVSKQVAEALKK